jgi:hypothetical protein
VFEGPDNGVQNQFKLGRGNGEKGREALRVHRLEEVEEMGPMLWVLLKVLERRKKLGQLKLDNISGITFYKE